MLTLIALLLSKETKDIDYAAVSADDAIAARPDGVRVALAPRSDAGKCLTSRPGSADLASWSRSARIQAAAACTRRLVPASRPRPSLSKIDETCESTVRSDRNSSAAIAALLLTLGDQGQHLSLARAQRAAQRWLDRLGCCSATRPRARRS